MTTFRTYFAFRVDTWTPDGESIVEHGAGIPSCLRGGEGAHDCRIGLVDRNARSGGQVSARGALYAWPRPELARETRSSRGFTVMMRMTIGVVFAAAFTISGAAQDFTAQSGVPAVAFPKPDRPVADIVSPIWHDEKERDNAGEPVNALGRCRMGRCEGRKLAGGGRVDPTPGRGSDAPLQKLGPPSSPPGFFQL
jgi:hypothetical protein